MAGKYQARAPMKRRNVLQGMLAGAFLRKSKARLRILSGGIPPVSRMFMHN